MLLLCYDTRRSFIHRIIICFNENLVSLSSHQSVTQQVQQCKILFKSLYSLQTPCASSTSRHLHEHHEVDPPSTPRCQSPSPQRQRLQLHSGGPNITPERYDSDDDAHNVGNIIPVAGNIAGAASIDATMFLVFGNAGERCGDEIAFEICSYVCWK